MLNLIVDCSMLLTSKNNVAPTTLLHPVFSNLLQLIICGRVGEQTSSLGFSPTNNLFVLAAHFILEYLNINMGILVQAVDTSVEICVLKCISVQYKSFEQKSKTLIPSNL